MSTHRDGRAMRSERARAAVVDALLSLMEEGDLRPTAERIAERAGVSLRLVFHHFTDLEALFAAAADRHAERIQPTLRTVAAEGPLQTRIVEFVAERTRLYEKISPVRRAALLWEPFSTVVAERIRVTRSWRRSELERVFATEIAAAWPAEREELVAALLAATSFSAFEAMRMHHGLPLEMTQRAMRRTLAALFATPRREE